MTVADRIALIANGDLVEFGRARDIYRTPEKSFTASFVGENNLLKGKVLAANDTNVMVDVAGSKLKVDKRGLAVSDGQDVSVSIRSECVAMDQVNGGDTRADDLSIIGSYDESVYLGLTTSHLVRLADGTEMISRGISNDETAIPPEGAQVRLSWKPTDIRLHVE